MQLLRLSGRKICERVLRQGQLWKGRHVLIRYFPGAPKHPSVDRTAPALYVGTVASAKLDKSAVRRNRMRRRGREALRTILRSSVFAQPSQTLRPADKASAGEQFFPQGPSAILDSYQLLLLPRASSLKAPFGEIQDDMKLFLATLLRG